MIQSAVVKSSSTCISQTEIARWRPTAKTYSLISMHSGFIHAVVQRLLAEAIPVKMLAAAQVRPLL